MYWARTSLQDMFLKLFLRGYLWMWALDYKESWVLKNWCFWTVVLEKTLESLLGCKEIQPVHPKGDKSWVFIGKTDAEAETPILWPPDVNNWLTGKDSDAGNNWRQEEKGMTEDEIVGWHHQLNGHEFKQAPRDGEGQGSLACGSPSSSRVSHDWATELNWSQQMICRACKPHVGNSFCWFLLWSDYLHCFPAVTGVQTCALPIWKDWCWSWNSNTLATWCE